MKSTKDVRGGQMSGLAGKACQTNESDQLWQEQLVLSAVIVTQRIGSPLDIYTLVECK